MNTYFKIVLFSVVAIIVARYFFASNNEPIDVATTNVNLYYYNPSLDVVNGNVECSERGLVSVNRNIPKSNSVIKDTIELLIQGNLNDDEMSQGITTEFPLNGFILESTSLANEVLTLTFHDPNNQSSGGSCRTSILLAQVTATARQFEGVSEVKILPNEVFQP